ncbi:MAG TPA: MFS transporter, partial [Steroidobacteraceae bacterium]|nr:MFS transporter [Steroidobacteraceae bacterium]
MGPSIRIDQLVDEQRFGWFNLSLLVWSFLAMFADGYDIGALSFALPKLQALWHVSPKALGLLSSASLVGILFGSPLFGLWGDRLGRRSAIIAGSVIYGVSSLAAAWSHGIYALGLLRFITGLGLGGVMPNTIALNSELAPRRLRATLITLMFVGITFGSGTPGLVAHDLLPRYGWPVLFLIGGAVPLVVAVCLWLWLPESVKFLARQPSRSAELLRTARRMRPDLSLPAEARFSTDVSESAAADDARQIFAGSLAWITPLLWLCFATALMSNYFLNSFLPLILDRSGMPPAKATLAATLYHWGGTAGGVLMSILLDRFGFLVVALLFALAVPAIAALGLVPASFAAIASLSSVAGLAVLGAQFGNNSAAGLLYPTAVRAKGVGWALGVGRFGAILGPSLGALLLIPPMHRERLFLFASAPMMLGGVAAVIVVWLCYRRLGGLQLGDIPREPAPLGA